MSGNGILIIGCGHWGPNYIRNFMDMEGIGQVSCCDKDVHKLSRMTQRFPGLHVCSDIDPLLKGGTITMAVVAAPATTHHTIINRLLDAGLDVLAEKPLTINFEEALALHQKAESNGLILMTAHTFLYNPAVRKIKELLVSGRIGRVYYLNATRTHMGLMRDDVNVMWDLAPHDVSIFNYLLGALPISVSATAACHLKPGREDVAFINLSYPDGVIANIHVSWEDSNKERTVRVVGSKARVVFDDISVLERVKIYEKGIGLQRDVSNYGEFQLSLRDGDIISPRVETTEPLRAMCQHFLECVRTRTRPLTDGYSGYEVVKVMCAINESAKHGGLVKQV